ncbi:MAG: hypothetical protein GY903_19715 [Fuerstiella sp.]|nr:hypothetical protein [Fuerstiella sp.]MCP4856715.1 hypothetical protein [Fuerstiella sp.]
MHVAEAKEKLGTRINWICDSMDNALKHALGDRPNSEFVFDPDGNLVVARQWSNPGDLRADLEELVGSVRRETTIADLNMKPLTSPKTAATGIVDRVKLPGQMTPVLTEPIMEASSEPFYVKLRAEVDADFFRTGHGQLYLGFFLDPLYKVHWNNRAMPVVFEVESTTGIVVADDSGEGPDVEVDADADPREFLLDLCDVAAGASRAPHEIVIKVRYFACDDAETFCKPVSQTYRVTLERDRDGGSRRTAGSRGGRPPGGGAFGGGPGARMQGMSREMQIRRQRNMQQQRSRRGPR